MWFCLEEEDEQNSERVGRGWWCSINHVPILCLALATTTERSQRLQIEITNPLYGTLSHLQCVSGPCITGGDHLVLKIHLFIYTQCDQKRVSFISK